MEKGVEDPLTRSLMRYLPSTCCGPDTENTAEAGRPEPCPLGALGLVAKADRPLINHRKPDACSCEQGHGGKERVVVLACGSSHLGERR